MSKKNTKIANDEAKPEVRHPSAEHVGKIRAATQGARDAEAAVGRAFLQLMGLTQNASQANGAAQEAVTKAAMSVGIDPTGTERWNYDESTMAFAKV